VAERVAAGDVRPLGDQRIGAPIARPHQILCIGLNYSDHAAGTGQAVPAEPILFTKSPDVRDLRMWLDVNGVRRVWLRPGDVMELGIDRLGVARQRVVAPR
jgi:2-keto-4-pentenoate hydratase/2-oxohepta-3-ene-1,7-dioic acid hydratase in catechol pathway